MKLSAELFTRITESVTIVGTTAPREADRRSPRVQLSNHLFAFRWSNPTEAMGIRVRDFSAGGAGIFHHDRLALDEQVVIRFDLPNNQNALVLSKVIYWEPLSPQLYGIGLGFDRVLETAEWISHCEQTAAQASPGLLDRLRQAVAPARRAAS